MYNHYRQQPTNVTVQFVLHNLIEIDDLQESIEFDCTIRLAWKDPRWVLNDLMDHLNPYELPFGVDIDALIDGGLRIWRPVIEFIDEIAITEIDQVTAIRGNGTVYWSRHVVLTLAQQQMDFHSYPLDTQNIQIRFDMLAIPSSVVNLLFATPGVLFSLAEDGTNTWADNDIWMYQQSSTIITEVNKGTSTNPSYFAYGILTVVEKRIGNGIVNRLAIPMACLVILVGLLFWNNRNERLGNTVFILLSVSTLYISVSNNVPKLGYSTYIGEFGLSMYGIVFICCFLHQVSYR